VATTVLQTTFTSSDPQATVCPHEPFSNWSVRRNTLFFSLKQYMCICYMTNFITVPRLCVFPSFLFLFGFLPLISFVHIFLAFFTSYFVIHPMWCVSDTLTKQTYWLQVSSDFHTYVQAHIFSCSLQNYGKQLLASSYLSASPSLWNSLAPTGWIFMKFVVGDQGLEPRLRLHCSH
jgi:hypothetical protein